VREQAGCRSISKTNSCSQFLLLFFPETLVTGGAKLLGPGNPGTGFRGEMKTWSSQTESMTSHRCSGLSFGHLSPGARWLISGN